MYLNPLRNRSFLLHVACNWLVLLLVVLLLAFSGEARNPTPSVSAFQPHLATPTPTPTPTAALQACHRHANTPMVELFYQHSGSDTVRCIAQEPVSDQDGSGYNPQVLSPRLDSVYAVCSLGGASVTVSYASYEEPVSLSMHALGTIDIYLEPDTCETVQKAVQEPVMAVTSVVLNPFYGGSEGTSPVSLLHQAPPSECATRHDFFTVWYKGGNKVCYANEGFLALAHPLEGVTKVCSGANSGGVILDTGPLTGLALSLDGEQCVTPDELLRESQISINEIVIAPAG